MVQLNCTEIIPIPSKCCLEYESMAFDGCHYYVIERDRCTIIKFNLHFCEVERILTSRNYSHICYDTKDKCFWALSKDSRKSIFRLNCRFMLIGCLEINYDPLNCVKLNSISYDCHNDCIVVAMVDRVLKVSKSGQSAVTLNTTSNVWIKGVLSLSPGCLVTAIKNSHQYIFIYGKDEVLLETFRCPSDLSLKNIIFNPCCHKKSNKIVLYALAINKCCVPCICKIILTTNELGFCPYDCNFDICVDCCKPKPPCLDPCSEALTSIALMQASIAHILNAEGEKIQKAIATTDDMDKIICVNREVNDTIINATHLEHILYAKLRELNKYCNPCHEKDNLLD